MTRLQEQTVAVAGANSLVGRALLPGLRARGARVVALVRRPVELPADEVIEDWMTSPAARRAMLEADAVVNLAGEFSTRGWAAYRAANVAPAEVVAGALREGRAERSVLVSYPGADPGSGNLFLRAKGEAERLHLESGKEAVVFRVSAIVNTPKDPGPFEASLIAERGPARTVGSGQGRLWPVYRGDVAAAILAALERGAPGVYDLGGPERMTLDDLARLVNRDAKKSVSHVPAGLARLLARLVPDLTPTVVDLMLRGDAGGGPSGRPGSSGSISRRCARCGRRASP